MSRTGVLFAVASLPAWATAAVRRAAQTTEDQLADAHLAGYQLCLKHMEEPPPAAVPVGAPRVPMQDPDSINVTGWRGL